MMASRRLRLAMLWWVWGGLLFVAMAIFSYQPILFGKELSAVWEWFLPNLMPTLTLVGAVVVFDGLPDADLTAGSNKHLFNIAMVASTFYLALLTLGVASVLFVRDPLASVHTSNLWLGPLQGLSASATGVFFTKQHAP